MKNTENNIEFLKKWSCNSISNDDIDQHCFEINSDFETKSRLNSRHWSTNKLRNLIDKDNDDTGWNIKDDAYNLCVWETSSKESDEPLGFVSFRFENSRDDENGKIYNTISLKLDLVFVRSDKRGNGVSKHLVTHFCHYLDECAPNKFANKDEDWSFSFYSEYYSEGGAQFSQIIEAELNYIRDSESWPEFTDISCDGGW